MLKRVMIFLCMFVLFSSVCFGVVVSNTQILSADECPENNRIFSLANSGGGLVDFYNAQDASFFLCVQGQDFSVYGDDVHSCGGVVGVLAGNRMFDPALNSNAYYLQEVCYWFYSDCHAVGTDEECSDDEVCIYSLTSPSFGYVKECAAKSDDYDVCCSFEGGQKQGGETCSLDGECASYECLGGYCGCDDLVGCIAEYDFCLGETIGCTKLDKSNEGENCHYDFDCNSGLACEEGACTSPDEICDDGLDNDFDGLVDCKDENDCTDEAGPLGLKCCGDEDVGCPSGSKCDDGGLEGSFTCLECLEGEWDYCNVGEMCSDGKCVSAVEDCTNGLDDDGDGSIDCKDDDCNQEIGPNGKSCCSYSDAYCFDDYPLCNKVTYECVECITKYDCGQNLVCKEGECITPECSKDSDCGFGEECDKGQGICFSIPGLDLKIGGEKCSSSSECESGGCMEGYCYCSSTVDCVSGYSCVGNPLRVCMVDELSGVGGECHSYNDCLDDLECNVEIEKCYSEEGSEYSSCDSKSDCNSGLICEDEVCVADGEDVEGPGSSGGSTDPFSECDSLGGEVCDSDFNCYQTHVQTGSFEGLEIDDLSLQAVDFKLVGSQPRCCVADTDKTPVCKKTEINPLTGEELTFVEGECIDPDEDGVGYMDVYVYGADGDFKEKKTKPCSSLDNVTTDLPFFSFFAVFLSLSLIVGFYVIRKL